MFRFVHAADVHLDSPLRGLDRYPGSPAEEIRGATREAFKNLVDLAIAERVAFVLIAGDLYDGDWRDYNTGLFLAAELSRLRAEGIRAFVIGGNHDAASRISRRLKLPENTRVFPASEAGTELLEDLRVAVHGRGFARREVREDLSTSFPPPRRGYFNIGMLHTNVGGREGHENYAPSSIEGLIARGYHYWALGHVHRREVLHEDPWIVYPGNLQGRHARETGSKGCTLVTVDDGVAVRVEHREVDVLRWASCRVTAELEDDADDVLERAETALRQALAEAADRPVAARIAVAGRTRAHASLVADSSRWLHELRARATDLGCGRLWLEKVEILTRSPREPLASEVDEALGGLVALLEETLSSDESLGELGDELAELRRKLPAELFSGEEGLDLESPRALRRIVDDVRRTLVPRLLETEELC